jgi:hypothetical protein
MRLRYTALLGAIGLYFAWNLQNALLAYISTFGCALLYSLRNIELQIGDLKGRLPSDQVPDARMERLWKLAEMPAVETSALGGIGVKRNN